jgi:hypothetical protein
LSTFCGTLKAGPKPGASCTSGKSSAGRVCSVKRLLPPLRISLACCVSRLTVWSAGMVRRMSISLRAPTVVASRRRRRPARPGADLDFQVAGGPDRAVLAHQHVGQDGQRVAALDDAGNRLQGRQHFVLCGFQDDHVFLWVVGTVEVPARGTARPGHGSAKLANPILSLLLQVVSMASGHGGVSP